MRETVSVELPWQRYTANWQPFAGGESVDGPGWSRIDEALAWARRRAPIVTVLLGSSGEDVYQAGERDATGMDAPRWAGSRATRDPDVEADYGGEVFVREEWPWIYSAKRFDATWEAEDGEVIERDDFDDLEQALAWARLRATKVVVAEIPKAHEGWPFYELRVIDDEADTAV